MTNIQFIQNQINAPIKGIENTINLLNEDCTIPFISRYRKDQTGNLDEVIIEQIAKLSKQFDEIVKRKESILKSIEEQGQLTVELKSKIEKSFDLQEIEDLYLTYKKKKKPVPMLLAKTDWNLWQKSSCRKEMTISTIFRLNI